MRDDMLDMTVIAALIGTAGAIVTKWIDKRVTTKQDIVTREQLVDDLQHYINTELQKTSTQLHEELSNWHTQYFSLFQNLAVGEEDDKAAYMEHIFKLRDRIDSLDTKIQDLVKTLEETKRWLQQADSK